LDEQGKKLLEKRWGTLTPDLTALRDALIEKGCGRISSGICQIPYLCGEILKNIIPCKQNEQQTMPAMKAHVRKESSQRKVFYFFMFPVFKKEDGCFRFVFLQGSKITKT